MKLLNKLKTMHEHNEFNYRLLQHIYFDSGNYALSIQASEHHYCHPKQTLALKEYTHFEVMTKIPKYDVPKNWLNDYDTGCGDVFAYVPVSEIEKLIDMLDKKYKMV